MVDFKGHEGPVEITARPIKGKLRITKSSSFFGGAFLAKKKAFIEAGLFPDYFFYSNEENDISMRLYSLGYHIKYSTDAILYHYPSLSGRPSSRKTYYYFRNKQIEIWRNLPLRDAISEHLLIICGGLIRSIASKQLAAFFRGFLMGMVMLPKVIVRERKPLDKAVYIEYCALRNEGTLCGRLRRMLNEAAENRKALNRTHKGGAFNESELMGNGAEE